MDEILVTAEEISAQENNLVEIIEQENEPKELYSVKVTHPSLRRRRLPNLQGEVVGLITDQGIYKIYEELNGWGKLDNGDWIMLSFTKPVEI